MKTITIDIRNAFEFQEKSLEQFRTILKSTGQVDIMHFDSLIKKNPKLLFAYEDDKIVGLGALKIPHSDYKDMVFERAESLESPQEFRFELGWIVSLIENRGIGTLIVKSLIEECDSNIYSTVRSINLQMIYILRKCGFSMDENDSLKDILLLIKKMKMNNWLPILEYYKSVQRTGPTIPFLIGSEEYLTGTKPKIDQILFEFTESSIPIFIGYCSTIDALVASLEDKLINPFSKKFKFGNLTCQDKDIDWIESLANLNDYLDPIYSSYLTNNKYSRRNQKWKKFNEDDKKLIRKAININI